MKKGKGISCSVCASLMADYEFIDADARRLVDSHVAECAVCGKLNLALTDWDEVFNMALTGDFADKSGDGPRLAEIDLSDRIMEKMGSSGRNGESRFYIHALLGVIFCECLFAVFAISGNVVELPFFKDGVQVVSAVLSESFSAVYSSLSFYTVDIGDALWGGGMQGAWGIAAAAVTVSIAAVVLLTKKIRVS